MSAPDVKPAFWVDSADMVSSHFQLVTLIAAAKDQTPTHNTPLYDQATVDALLAEVARLQSCLDTLHGRRFSERAYEALHSRAEKAEADAKRYEWIRGDWPEESPNTPDGRWIRACVFDGSNDLTIKGDELDAEIDAAMLRAAP